jgi:heterodisulfide reductase subunit A-like polyferredoxin
MNEISSNLSRRKFMIISSTAIASPLLMNATGSMAAAKMAEARTSEQKTAKPGKIYFIGHGCVGCQTCRTFCPAKAIHFGDTGNEIDQKKCMHCGTCYRECPISVVTETSL